MNPDNDLTKADFADIEARELIKNKIDASEIAAASTTTEPDLVLVTPEERARAKTLEMGRPTGTGHPALMAALLTASGLFDNMSYSHTLPGLPKQAYDADAAAKLREERRLRKAANFAKRQPKGNK